MDLQKEREAFELVVANQLQNSLYHSVFFNEATGYDCADDAPAAVQFFCCDLNSDWRIWKAAKAQAVPDGFVLVPKKSIEHWYFDEGEYLWMDEPDNWLCDMDVGEVQEVEHKEYIITESNTLYATKIWDDENQDVSTWEFFNSKNDAEKAAEYCKAMIEAQEPAND